MKCLTAYLCIFINFLFLIKALLFVKYEFKEGTNISLQYAIAAMGKSSAGYKIDEKLGLPTFIDDTVDQDDPRISYFNKKITITRFEVGWPTSGLILRWKYPGIFKVGAKLEIKLGLPQKLFKTSRATIHMSAYENLTIAFVEIAIGPSGDISVYSRQLDGKQTFYLSHINYLSSETTHSVVIEAKDIALMVCIDENESVMTDVPYMMPIETIDDSLTVYSEHPGESIRLKEIIFTHA